MASGHEARHVARPLERAFDLGEPDGILDGERTGS